MHKRWLSYRFLCICFKKVSACFDKNTLSLNYLHFKDKSNCSFREETQQEPRINTLTQRHVAVNLPVVITFIPVVKVHQESTIHHVGNRGNTDERGILLIDGLQLHTNPKP